MSDSAKYIFVTGGVTSSLGKGIISASLAKLLQSRNYSVTIQKLDPYINVDPGTLNPYEHGECYVTDDGAETDLDLGHYERFLNVPTSQGNNVTTGRIYQSVINKERKGEYLGKTVQIIPHITDEIKRSVQILGSKNEYDFIITEIGGTVGDIESLPYVEALRQLKWEKPEDVLNIHLTLVPYLSAAGELKTKPTQHSVKQLLEFGVQPDILVCRTEHKLPPSVRTKIARFCNVAQNAVIESIDADTIYDVPLLLLNGSNQYLLSLGCLHQHDERILQLICKSPLIQHTFQQDQWLLRILDFCIVPRNCSTYLDFYQCSWEDLACPRQHHPALHQEAIKEHHKWCQHQ